MDSTLGLSAQISFFKKKLITTTIMTLALIDNINHQIDYSLEVEQIVFQLEILLHYSSITIADD